MKKSAFLVAIVTLITATPILAICAWVEQNCDTNGPRCYSRGTGGCENYSCASEQIPKGKITIYDDENSVIATGEYDMSKTTNDNCTATFDNNW